MRLIKYTRYWVTEIGKGEYDIIARYEYDQLGRRTAVKYGNNTVSFEYDIGNRLKRLTNSLTGGATFDFNYADYDKVGNRLSCKEGTANKKIYDYDNLYQLTVVDYNDGNMTDYYYDKLGNRTSVINGGTASYTSNALNQYESVAGTNYTYDKNGNLTFDGVYHYYYDCENRLTEVNDVNNQRVATHKYDFKGRRVAKTVGSITTTFVYDGEQIIQEYRDGYGRWKTYYYGPGIDELIRMIGWENPGEPGITYYYDGLGSVIALADYMGNVVEKYSYDVFGKPTIRNAQGAIRTTSAVGNRYMFTGREYEQETGLYYYRARYYHPTIGRFVQADPIGYDAGLNLFSYVGNNPVNMKDPLGLFPCDRDALKQCQNKAWDKWNKCLEDAESTYERGERRMNSWLEDCSSNCKYKDPWERVHCKEACQAWYGFVMGHLHLGYLAKIAGCDLMFGIRMKNCQDIYCPIPPYPY